MQVWVINPFDELPNEPGRPGRYWSLCHVLAEQGHEVVWWTADFSHRRKIRRSAEALVEDVGRGRRTPPGHDELKTAGCGDPALHSLTPSLPHSPTPFRIRLIPITAYQSNVGVARLRSHRVFGRNLEQALRAETATGRKPDRIVASWPPVEGGEVAVRLGQEWHVPVTIDIQDAWPEAFANFIPGPAWVARLALAPWRRRARKVFTASERVSGVGQAFLDYARSMGASGPTHLAYLGAWFGEEMECRAGPPQPAASSLPDVGRGRRTPPSPDPAVPFSQTPAGCGDPALQVHPTTARGSAAPRLVGFTSAATRQAAPLRLLYLGNIGRSQDLATVVAGVALARAQGHDVRLDIAGSGEREPELKQAIMEAGLGETVRLHGFLSGAALDALFAEVHIGVNPVRGESLIACPNKVADYLEAGLPIMNSLPGELAGLLAKYDAGRGFTVGKPDTFAAALCAWVAEPASVARMSAGARLLGEACFAREKTYPALARFVIGNA
jgi:glycosyltransferase involved in cell wall biosynthesis